MSKKQFLIIAANQLQLIQMYSFIADCTSPIHAVYRDNEIETDDYVVTFALDGDESVLDKRWDSYIYRGSDKEYEAKIILN